MDLQDYIERRAREVKMDNQATLKGKGELEALYPALNEILKGNYRNFIVGLETRDGIILISKSRGSRKLVEACL